MNGNTASPTGQRVVVVGGGVIGAFCAWYLVKAGFAVTIVERGQFGQACSHGNCGYVSPSHILPLTRPGVLRETLPALLRPNSPLRIRLRWSPSLWYWLWRFSKRCNSRDMMESAVGRHELLQSSQQLYKQWIAAEDIDCEWTEKGLLFVFASIHHFDEYEKTNRLLTDEFGVSAVPLEGERLVQHEPALKSGLGGGWLYRGDCHLRPDKLMSALRANLQRHGVEIVEQFEIDQFVREAGICRAVSSSNGSKIEADAFVVATGAWSPFLNRHLGCQLPIQPGKGYSLTMPCPKIMPDVPMVLEEHRVAITPMHSKYRIGSTMEFAGYDTSINRTRLEMLKSSAEYYLRDPHTTPIEEEWFGWRPMTWDGKPIIDRSPAMHNVWIAAGHNMLGISMATGTGKLIGELLSGEPTHIDVSHYALDRFQ